jgi:hypothetical protein
MIFISMLKSLIRKYVRLIAEAEGVIVPGIHLGRPNPEIDENEEKLDEFSSVGGGNIQGMTLPLGMAPKKPAVPTVGTKKRFRKRAKVQ